ncbi:MAG TPA: hypothetical protein ENG62_01315 [Thermoplasmatales archaeon]|nr:hypothetical protein [Thermoplasmatales archaeon]
MSKTRGVSSERIARRLLESRGFHIIDTNHKIIDGDEKIAEIDILAEDKNGVRYAVEVKAGRGDVAAIRQTYANADLCNCKPMLICKGFSDEAARRVAEKLGVEVVELSEYYLLLDPEELENLIKKCVEEVFETHGLLPYTTEISEEDKSLLRIIATSSSFREVAEKLSISLEELGDRIKGLTKRGILPQRSLSFRDLKQCSSSILARGEILEKLNNIERYLKTLLDGR